MIADPDICQFQIEPGKHDFVLLGCDGIFDKFEDKDCVHTVWQNAINQANFEKAEKAFEQNKGDEDRYPHDLCGAAVDAVLKSTALRRSADNITVVFVAFDHFFEMVRQSRGDVSKFEYNKLELQQIDLEQPPNFNYSTKHTAPAPKAEIFIGDTAQPEPSDLNEPLVGDTGDH